MYKFFLSKIYTNLVDTATGQSKEILYNQLHWQTVYLI